METNTIGEHLYWSYANLAMAHAAVSDCSERYNQKHFIIRSRLYRGLTKGTMKIGDIADDEKLKMILPQSCAYCGSKNYLSADHLLSKKRGGNNCGDNLVWSCRSCNSSKGAADMLEWLAKRQIFPPLLLLRRYLKLSIAISVQNQIMDRLVSDTPEVPFQLSAVPTSFPEPSQLRLWVTALPETT
jgi:hypothetical protein